MLIQKIIVLGFRPGMQKSIEDSSFSPIYISPVFKQGMVSSRDIIVDNIENAEEIIRAIERHDHTQIAGVVTAHEDGIFCAALLRSIYNTVGDKDFVRALYFRDKLLQKKKLALNCSTNICIPVTKDSNFNELSDLLGTPFILKPSNGMASKKTYSINSHSEWLVLAPKINTSLSYIAESFSRGEEYFIDGIWENGTLKWFSLGQNIQPILKATKDGHVIGYLLMRNEFEALYKQIEPRLIEWLTALNTPTTVFHLEFFKNEDSIIFGECAARVAGALVPELIQNTYGVNLYDIQLKISLNIPYKIESFDGSPSGFIFFKHPKDKQLSRDMLLSNFNFIDLKYDPTSDTQNLAYNNIGYGIVSKSNNHELQSHLRTISEFCT